MKASSLIAVLLLVATAALAAPTTIGGTPVPDASKAWAPAVDDDGIGAAPADAAAAPSLIGMDDLDAIPDGGAALPWASRTDPEPSPGAEVPSPGPEVPSPSPEF